MPIFLLSPQKNPSFPEGIESVPKDLCVVCDAMTSDIYTYSTAVRSPTHPEFLKAGVTVELMADKMVILKTKGGIKEDWRDRLEGNFTPKEILGIHAAYQRSFAPPPQGEKEDVPSPNSPARKSKPHNLQAAL